MASRDKVDVDTFHKSIQYALEKLGKPKSGFERTVVSKFKRKRRVGSGNEIVRLFSFIFTGLGDFTAKESILWTADSLVLITGITCI